MHVVTQAQLLERIRLENTEAILQRFYDYRHFRHSSRNLRRQSAFRASSFRLQRPSISTSTLVEAEGHYSRPAAHPEVAVSVVVFRNRLVAVPDRRIHLVVVHTVPDLEEAVHIHLVEEVRRSLVGEVHQTLAEEVRHNRLEGDRFRSRQSRPGVVAVVLLSRPGCHKMNRWHREAA